VVLCAFSFTFFLFARDSNIVPYSVHSFNPRTNLCRGDIVFFISCFARFLATDDSPAFVLQDSAGRFYPLTKAVFDHALRSRLQGAGIAEANTFRGHSFRRGANSWAFKMGIPGEFIQIYGDWASDAYKAYLEFSMPCKLFVADKMRERLSASLLTYVIVSSWSTQLIPRLAGLVGGLRSLLIFSLSLIVVQNKLLTVPNKE
jgi:hypothetical protein